MRDPKRIDEFCDRLKTAWSQFPDMRFGQMMVGAFTMMEKSGKDPFYREDNEMIEFLEQFLSK